MKKLLVLLCILGAAVTLFVACTPQQQATFKAMSAAEQQAVLEIMSAETTTTTTQPPPPPPPAPPPNSHTACGQAESHKRAMGMPCSEVDRAVSEAAIEFRIDERTFRRVINCESHFVPTAGSYYRGLTQQSQEFFNRWLPRFNAAVDPDLGAGRAYPSRDFPWDNARLAAFVISRNGYDEWGICYP